MDDEQVGDEQAAVEMLKELRGHSLALECVVRGLVAANGDKDSAKGLQRMLDLYERDLFQPMLRDWPEAGDSFKKAWEGVFRGVRNILEMKLA